MSLVATLSAIGAALSGAGAAASAAGTFSGGKRKVREQLKAQKNLAAYNQQIYLDNYERQKADAIQAYLDYESPEALVRQAKAAGLNPDVVAGQAGGSGVGSFSGTPGTASGNVDVDSKGAERIGFALQTLGEALGVANSFRKIEDENRARKYSLQAQNLENRAKSIQNSKAMIEALEQLKEVGRNDKRFEQETKRWQWELMEETRKEAAEYRQSQAHLLEMESLRNEIVMQGLELQSYPIDKQIEREGARARNRLTDWQAQNEEWAVEFQRKYGIKPPSGMNAYMMAYMLGINALGSSAGDPNAVDSQGRSTNVAGVRMKMQALEAKLKREGKLSGSEWNQLKAYRKISSWYR